MLPRFCDFTISEVHNLQSHLKNEISPQNVRNVLSRFYQVTFVLRSHDNNKGSYTFANIVCCFKAAYWYDIFVESEESVETTWRQLWRAGNFLTEIVPSDSSVSQVPSLHSNRSTEKGAN